MAGRASQLNRTIFAACRELGVDDETRRLMQIAATGIASLKDMDEGEKESVIAYLKQKGWKPKPKRGKKFHPRAPRADVRFIHKLWTLLGQAGALKNPTREGLNRFIRARFEETWGAVPIDVDKMREADEIRHVIEALKDWCEREGITLDG